MSTAKPLPRAAPPPLIEGERPNQREFHRRYKAMPPGTRAELINGVVYMPSAVGRAHGRAQVPAIVWGPKLDDYQRAGVREYVVRALEPDEVLWHVVRNNRLVAVPPAADGLYRSTVFPVSGSTPRRCWLATARPCARRSTAGSPGPSTPSSLHSLRRRTAAPERDPLSIRVRRP